MSDYRRRAALALVQLAKLRRLTTAQCYRRCRYPFSKPTRWPAKVGRRCRI